jgi:putative flippase GtrA
MRFGRQFLVFVGVGGASAVIDISTMQVLVRLGVHYGLAVSVGFFAGLIVNYIFHARVTFKAVSSLGTLGRFAAVVFSNYLITLLFVFISDNMVASILLGKFASLPVVAFNGFLLSKYWVFR